MTRKKYDAKEAKTIKAKDVVEALGLETEGKFALCPGHNDKSPSMHIYDDHVHCFSCGFNVDNVGLVMKVKGWDFGPSLDFLGDRFGLPLTVDYEKSQGKRGDLGNGRRGKGGKLFPKSPTAQIAQLDNYPVSDREATATQGEDLGNGKGGIGGDTFPKSPTAADDRPLLPRGEWVDGLPDFAAARRLQLRLCDRWVVSIGRDAAGYYVRSPQAQPRKAQEVDVEIAPLRFLLDLCIPATGTEAGRRFASQKGIEAATQARYGLLWLPDYGKANEALKARFDVDTLEESGLLSKKGNLRFFKHRLLFPFFHRGEAVDVQGRYMWAKKKGEKFMNRRSTGVGFLVPYNVDAVAQAREEGRPVFICEGCSDTLALAQSGRLSVGIIGVNGFKGAWLPAFKGLKVYIAFDGDEAGRNAAKKLAKLFVDNGLRSPKIVPIPEGKDIAALFNSRKEEK